MLRGTGGDHVVVAMNLVHVRRENGREEFHPFQMKPSFSLYIISLSIDHYLSPFLCSHWLGLGKKRTERGGEQLGFFLLINLNMTELVYIYRNCPSKYNHVAADAFFVHFFLGDIQF